MFYRIKDNTVADYADFEYADGCLFTTLCTMKEYDKNKDNYLVQEGKLVINPNLDEILVQRKKDDFERNFFKTNLGWIRRKVTMKDGSNKDFLSDLLLPIKAGMELGQAVEIIVYDEPDYTMDFTKEYIESLQSIKIATPDFIQECLFQTVQDFGLEKGGNNVIQN